MEPTGPRQQYVGLPHTSAGAKPRRLCRRRRAPKRSLARNVSGGPANERPMSGHSPTWTCCSKRAPRFMPHRAPKERRRKPLDDSVLTGPCTRTRSPGVRSGWLTRVGGGTSQESSGRRRVLAERPHELPVLAPRHLACGRPRRQQARCSRGGAPRALRWRMGVAGRGRMIDLGIGPTGIEAWAAGTDRLHSAAQSRQTGRSMAAGRGIARAIYRLSHRS
jgi:hypothetical protein